MLKLSPGSRTLVIRCFASACVIDNKVNNYVNRMDRYYLLQYDGGGDVCNPYCKYYLLYGENGKNEYEEMVNE